MQDKYLIEMLRDERGCDEGVIYPVMFQEGKQYEIGKGLYDGFVSIGACKLVDGKKAADKQADIEARETKVEQPEETKNETKKRGRKSK